MATKSLNLIYAIKDSVPIGIENVESGLKCGCTCPACGDPLIAKKGEKRLHHFAHSSGHSCEYGYESSLHLAAKDILAKAKKIMVPAAYVSFPDSHKPKELYCDAQEIEIECVELEQRFDGIIPDVVIYTGGKKIFLEVYVTHPIDEHKLTKIKNMDVSTIEIDLSKKDKTITYDELKVILLGNSTEKTWKHHSDEKKQLNRFYKAANKLEIIPRGCAMHIDNCPLSRRVWYDKPYANFIDDCLDCEYCISHNYEGGILCSGKARISSIEDFNLPKDKRNAITRKMAIAERIKKKAEADFAAGKCPKCGGNLVENHREFGTIWRCETYPHCNFFAAKSSNTEKVDMNV